jgi:hypothetical protein
LLLGLVGSIAGCAVPREPSLGTVTANLVGQAPSGAVYRLRHAVITVTGPGSTRIWNTEDDPDRTSLSDDVPVGNYSASLAAGWDLERIEGASATPVTAQLVSDNPMEFLVSPDQRTSVPLRFHVDTEVVDLSQGYDLVLTVEESTPRSGLRVSRPRVRRCPTGSRDRWPAERPVQAGRRGGALTRCRLEDHPLCAAVDQLPGVGAGGGSAAQLDSDQRPRKWPELAVAPAK